jgi:hypothetical protein
MMTFQTLMAGHRSAEIFCLYTGKLARRLTVKGDLVEIDALTIKVEVRMATPILHKPWVFDRGDMTFYAPDLDPPIGTVAKLCGEGDPIKFDDGTESHVMPQ